MTGDLWTDLELYRRERALEADAAAVTAQHRARVLAVHPKAEATFYDGWWWILPFPEAHSGEALGTGHTTNRAWAGAYKELK